MTPTTCPICGQAGLRVALTGTDHREGLGGTFSILECRRCGHGVTDPVPSDLSAWYPVSYQQHTAGDGLTTRVVMSSARAVVLRPRAAWPLERLVPDAAFGGPLGAGARVLDVGAGNGSIVRALREAGVDAEGVEPSASAVEAARRAGCTAVIEGTIDDVADSHGPFDVIRIHHVLEHVPDPIATLRVARSLLTPSGRVVIIVPNFGGGGRRAFGRAWDGLELPRHLHHFTSRSLGVAATRAGLAPGDTRTVAIFGCLAGSLDARAHGGERQQGWGNALAVRAGLYPVELAAAALGLGDGLLRVATRD